MAVRARRRRRKSRARLQVVWGVILGVAAVVLVRAQPVLGGLVLVVLLLAAVAAPLRRALNRRAKPTGRRIKAPDVPGQALVERPPGGFAATAGMTGTQFEERIQLLLEDDGCEDVRVVGGAGDRGADLTAISPYGDRIVVQCKRYKAANPVRDPEMQRFLGTARQVHNAAIPLFVTTSRFTLPAQRLAREHGIVLVDGLALDAWMAGGPSPVPREPTEYVG